MQIIKIEFDLNHQSAVQSQTNVTFEISKIEKLKLKEALRLIKKYKKTACEALNPNPLGSEWTMFNYVFDQDNLTIEIRDGMIG